MSVALEHTDTALRADSAGAAVARAIWQSHSHRKTRRCPVGPNDHSELERLRLHSMLSILSPERFRSEA